MNFSDEQQNMIKNWLEQGDSLSDVQKKIKENFDVVMTYLDVRLMVMSLGAGVKDKPEPKPKTENSDESQSASNLQGNESVDFTPPADGTVSVSVDSLKMPGILVSGSVVFSDGARAKWMFDQSGRFGFEPETAGYKPSQADMEKFQVELQQELSSRGF